MASPTWAQCRRCIHNVPDDCLPGPKTSMDSSWRSFPTYGWRCPRRCTWWQRFLPMWAWGQLVTWRCRQKEGA